MTEKPSIASAEHQPSKLRVAGSSPAAPTTTPSKSTSEIKHFGQPAFADPRLTSADGQGLDRIALAPQASTHQQVTGDSGASPLETTEITPKQDGPQMVRPPGTGTDLELARVREIASAFLRGLFASEKVPEHTIDGVANLYRLIRAEVDTLAMVREWHLKFGVPVCDVPAIPPADRVKLRLELIREELRELQEAFDAGDIVEVADALGDLKYVIDGCALECGVPLNAVSTEVHRSNMSKVWADGTVHYREDGKVLKPPTYSPADVAGVLGAARG